MDISKFVKAIFAIFLISFSVNSQWFQLNSGVTSQLYAVYFLNQNTGIAAGSSGNILRTTNAGSTWFINTIIDPLISYNSIYFIDQNTGYICGRILYLDSNTIHAFPKIIKTTNAGINWTLVFSDSGYTLKSIYFLNANTGFAGGGLFTLSTNYLLMTTNGGLNWQKTSPGDGYLWPIAFKDANTGFISCFGGYIYKTTNSGLNWSLFQSLVSNDCLPGLTFIDANTGFVVGGRSLTNDSLGSIYRTIDGGNNWNPVYNDHKGMLNYICFENSNTGFAVGTLDVVLTTDSAQGRIIKTTNSGSNWFIDTLFTYLYGFTSVSFPVVNTGYVVGNNGVILKTTTGGNLMGITPISKEVPNRFSLSQNYPNPFNPTTTIKFDIQKEVNVSLSVYDALGNKVETLVNGDLKAGIYRVNWDGTRFSSGIYFYKLSAGNFVDTKKMILLK